MGNVVVPLFFFTSPPSLLLMCQTSPFVPGCACYRWCPGAGGGQPSRAAWAKEAFLEAKQRYCRCSIACSLPGLHQLKQLKLDGKVSDLAGWKNDAEYCGSQHTVEAVFI